MQIDLDIFCFGLLFWVIVLCVTAKFISSFLEGSNILFPTLKWVLLHATWASSGCRGEVMYNKRPSYRLASSPASNLPIQAGLTENMGRAIGFRLENQLGFSLARLISYNEAHRSGEQDPIWSCSISLNHKHLNRCDSRVWVPILYLILFSLTN